MSGLSRPLYSRAIALLAQHTHALPCNTHEIDVAFVARLYDVPAEHVAEAVRHHWRHVERMRRAYSTDTRGPWSL